MNLSQKQSIFADFFYAFFESALNFEYFQKKVTLVAYEFPKLLTTKDVLRYIPKRSSLRGPQDSRHGKRAEALIQY